MITLDFLFTVNVRFDVQDADIAEYVEGFC